MTQRARRGSVGGFRQEVEGHGMSIFDTWQHKWYGVWRLEADPIPNWPAFSELVDPSWVPGDKALLVDYLRAAPIVAASPMKPTSCHLCGESRGRPGNYCSDGVWLWPWDLAHFVAKHDVRLPDEMARHIRAAGYKPPQRLPVSPDKLPWPWKLGKEVHSPNRGIHEPATLPPPARRRGSRGDLPCRHRVWRAFQSRRV